MKIIRALFLKMVQLDSELGNLVDEKLINADRYAELTELAKKFVVSF